jgi:Icc-related predicted phosphoesterase
MYNNLFKRSASLLQYVSDLHLEKGYKRNIIPSKKYLILAGDIGYPDQNSYKNFLLDMSFYFDKVFILSGNHEYDNCDNTDIIDMKINNICSMRNNLYFLQKKSYVICDVYNIKLSGCTFWSILPKSKYNLHLNHKKWLEDTLCNEKEYNHIIATHHCPLFECLNKVVNSKTANYFATDQTEIIKKTNVVGWIHGHSHINKNINMYGKTIVSNQYGSYENPLYKFNN